MRRRALLSLITSLALPSCAHQSAPAVSSTDGMRWIEVQGEEPKLAFGAPDSDVLVLMMTCAPKSGAVSIAFFAGPSAPGGTLHLSSGKTHARLAARATAPDAEGPTNDVVVEADSSATAPVLTSFARTGELSAGTSGSAMPLPTAEPRMASRFVERCAR